MRVMFPNQECAVMDAGGDARGSQGAVAADSAVPFEAVLGDASAGAMQAAAVGAGVTGGTDGLELAQVDVELRGCE